MSAKSFLILNGLVLLALIVRMITARKSPAPTPLLQADSASKPAGKEHSRSGDGFRPAPETFHGQGNSDSSAPEGGLRPDPSEPRSLNCPFQFDGRPWDAYQVLGLPAGSSLEACRRALVDLRRNGQHSQAFLDALWAAVTYGRQ